MFDQLYPSYNPCETLPAGYVRLYGRVLPPAVADFIRNNFGDYIQQLECDNRELASANSLLVKNFLGKHPKASHDTPSLISELDLAYVKLNVLQEKAAMLWLIKLYNNNTIEDLNSILNNPGIPGLFGGEVLAWFLNCKKYHVGPIFWENFVDVLLKECRKRAPVLTSLFGLPKPGTWIRVEDSDLKKKRCNHFKVSDNRPSCVKGFGIGCQDKFQSSPFKASNLVNNFFPQSKWVHSGKNGFNSSHSNTPYQSFDSSPNDAYFGGFGSSQRNVNAGGFGSSSGFGSSQINANAGGFATSSGNKNSREFGSIANNIAGQGFGSPVSTSSVQEFDSSANDVDTGAFCSISNNESARFGSLSINAISERVSSTSNNVNSEGIIPSSNNVGVQGFGSPAAASNTQESGSLSENTNPGGFNLSSDNSSPQEKECSANSENTQGSQSSPKTLNG